MYELIKILCYDKDTGTSNGARELEICWQVVNHLLANTLIHLNKQLHQEAMVLYLYFQSACDVNWLLLREGTTGISLHVGCY